MIAFLSENIATIIGALIVFGVFFAVILRLIRKHKKGEGSCSCGCGGCASSEICHPKKQ